MAYKNMKEQGREEGRKEREEFLSPFCIDIFWQILKLVCSEFLESVCSGKMWLEKVGITWKLMLFLNQNQYSTEI